MVFCAFPLFLCLCLSSNTWRWQSHTQINAKPQCSLQQMPVHILVPPEVTSHHFGLKWLVSQVMFLFSEQTKFPCSNIGKWAPYREVGICCIVQNKGNSKERDPFVVIYVTLNGRLKFCRKSACLYAECPPSPRSSCINNNALTFSVVFVSLKFKESFMLVIINIIIF